MLVRVHIEDRLYDTLSAIFHETSWSLRAAMQRIAEEPEGGVLVLLRGDGDPAALVAYSAKISERLGWKPQRDLTAMVADAWAFARR